MTQGVDTATMVLMKKIYESKRVETTIQSPVSEVQEETPENRKENASIETGFRNGKNERMYTESQVAKMLEEVQTATTTRIFQKLNSLFEEKMSNLAPPFITKQEIQILEEEYASNSQSFGGK